MQKNCSIIHKFIFQVHSIHNSRFPSLGIPSFSFLPRFLPNLMIFIITINLSSFIGTICIEKSSNLSKIWAEMRKPMLEYLRWTLEF